jgi:hypothetical protein
MSEVSLYTRLGGYDALAAAVDNLLVRVRADGLLGRFWRSPRSDATNNRERQLTPRFYRRSDRWTCILHGSGHEDGARWDGHYHG